MSAPAKVPTLEVRELDVYLGECVDTARRIHWRSNVSIPDPVESDGRLLVTFELDGEAATLVECDSGTPTLETLDDAIWALTTLRAELGRILSR